jgi:hypothetical protein
MTLSITYVSMSVYVVSVGCMRRRTHEEERRMRW